MLYGNLKEFIMVLASTILFLQWLGHVQYRAAWLLRAILAGCHVGSKEDKLSFAQGDYSPFRKVPSVKGKVKQGTPSSVAP